MARDISDRKRFQVLERDRFRCRYCGITSIDGPLVMDHVIPRNLGGSNLSTNLTASCTSCNSGKSDSMPPIDLIEEVVRAQVAYDEGIGKPGPCARCSRPANFTLPPTGDPACGVCISAFTEGVAFAQGGAPL